MRDGRHLLLSKSNRLHVQGNFAFSGDALRGKSSLVWAACGSRLTDPDYVEDDWRADIGRRTCKRCFP